MLGTALYRSRHCQSELRVHFSPVNLESNSQCGLFRFGSADHGCFVRVLYSCPSCHVLKEKAGSRITQAPRSPSPGAVWAIGQRISLAGWIDRDIACEA